MYIHELREWPRFSWRSEAVKELLNLAYVKLKVLQDDLNKLGFDEQTEASLRVLTEEAVKTSEIEGEKLDPQKVRSSIARKLGLPEGGLHVNDHRVDGIVEVVLNASQKCDQPLTKERLFSWHGALFPTGYSGLSKILVGQWRDDSDGPMQVVSGPYGHRRVHFEAPGHLRVPGEMDGFLKWFENETSLDPLLKAGIAHLYFVTIHPFDDGNGRIARAIADMALARADKMTQRYSSMSAQITFEKEDYYDTLESTQKGTLEITNWLVWFLECLVRAIDRAEKVLIDILLKARVWKSLTGFEINDRQREILNRLLDKTFYGELGTAKYSKMMKCSPDTSNRDLNQLVEYGVLERTGKGKGTRYHLRLPA